MMKDGGGHNTGAPTMGMSTSSAPQVAATVPSVDGGDSDYYPNPYGTTSGPMPPQYPCDAASAPPVMTPFRREEQWEVNDARPMLPMAAFFMGDLRDGIAMINMQTTFLISAKGFTEKQVGVLFFVFGVCQTVCMVPVGYWFDYIENKIRAVMGAAVAISTLTVLTALLAQPDGGNMRFMIVIKALQGVCTAFLPPGLNGITLGIVGSSGFTEQVARNKMYSHIGTALAVAIATLIAYGLFPQMGPLFFVSPLATYGCCYYFARIRPEHIDSDAARGLIINSPTMTEYEQMDEENEAMEALKGGGDRGAGTAGSYCGNAAVPQDCWGAEAAYVPPTETTMSPPPPSTPGNAHSVRPMPRESPLPSMGLTPPAVSGVDPRLPTVHSQTKGSTSEASSPNPPSFRLGLDRLWGGGAAGGKEEEDDAELGRRAQTPLAVLLDPTLLTFAAVIFFFHLSNSSVLPLVMQSLSHGAVTRNGILYSSLCIIVAQAFMTFFSRICGVYSPVWGRKRLFLAGLFSLPLRCFLLSVLVSPQTGLYDVLGKQAMDFLVISTQFLDAVGAGIFGTLYVLVTNDISGGSGRFSLLLGITTGAMCIGGMLSGYIGQALAQDYGYDVAFYALGLLSLIPAFLYLFFMPETLPDHAKPKPKKRKRLHHLLVPQQPPPEGIGGGGVPQQQTGNGAWNTPPPDRRVPLVGDPPKQFGNQQMELL